MEWAAAVASGAGADWLVVLSLALSTLAAHALTVEVTHRRASVLIASLSHRALIMVITLALRAGDEWVANVASGTRTHSLLLISTLVETNLAIGAGTTGVRVAIIIVCEKPAGLEWVTGVRAGARANWCVVLDSAVRSDTTRVALAGVNALVRHTCLVIWAVVVLCAFGVASGVRAA